MAVDRRNTKKDAGDEVIVFKDGEVFYAGLLSVETTINIEDEKGNFNIVHIKDGKAVMKKPAARIKYVFTRGLPKKTGRLLFACRIKFRSK